MIRCYRDEYGMFRAEVTNGHSNLGNFLEQDVQGSVKGAQLYLDVLQSVMDGREAEWSGTGNAHTVTISPSGVTIENVWDEGLGTAVVSLDDFKQALLSWQACISAETA